MTSPPLRRPRPSGSLVRTALAATAVLVLLACSSTPTGGPTAEAARTNQDDTSLQDRPFWQRSPWTDQLPTDVRVDVRSASIVAHLASGEKGAVANLYDYGIPVYDARQSTQQVAVECTMPWGTCALERSPVPIPAEALPNPGSDRAMVVVDRGRGATFEFWQATPGPETWTVSWGSSNQLDGDGRQGGSGSGVSRLAGVVRLDEVESGEITHALALATDNTCADEFRFPARTTDGTSRRADCVPEGARLRLDPSIDLAAIADITEGELMVGRALQTYGAIVVDSADALMAFFFERPTGEDDPYPDLGFTWDYFGMRRIPWDALSVIAPTS